MAVTLVGLNPRRPFFAVGAQALANSSQRTHLLRSLCSTSFFSEAALLVTEGRLEILVSGSGSFDALAEVAQVVSATLGVSYGDVIANAYYGEGADAALHLFSAVGGRDWLGAQVPGAVIDGGIAEAQAAGALGEVLGRLLQQAKQLALRVQQGSRASGSIDVVPVVASLARHVFDRLSCRGALLLGDGDAGRKVAQALESAGVSRFFEVAEGSLSGEAAGFPGARRGTASALAVELPKADFIVVSDEQLAGLVRKDAMHDALRRRRGRPVLVFDVTAGSAVEGEIGTMDEVYLFRTEHLEELSGQGPQWSDASSSPERLISEELERFNWWMADRSEV